MIGIISSPSPSGICDHVCFFIERLTSRLLFKKNRMIVDRNPVRSRSALHVFAKIFIQNDVRRVTHQINQHAQDCKVRVHRPGSVKLKGMDQGRFIFLGEGSREALN